MNLAAQLEYIGFCALVLFVFTLTMLAVRHRRAHRDEEPEPILKHEDIGLDEDSIGFFVKAKPPDDGLSIECGDFGQAVDHNGCDGFSAGPGFHACKCKCHVPAEDSDTWWQLTFAELRGKAHQDWRYRLDRDLDRLLDAAWTQAVHDAEEEIRCQTQEMWHLVDCALETTGEVAMGVGV